MNDIIPSSKDTKQEKTWHKINNKNNIKYKLKGKKQSKNNWSLHTKHTKHDILDIL